MITRFPAAESFLRRYPVPSIACPVTLDLYGYTRAVPNLLKVRCDAQHAGHGGDALEFIVASIDEGSDQ